MFCQRKTRQLLHKKVNHQNSNINNNYKIFEKNYKTTF